MSLTFLDDVDVRLIRNAGGDESVVQAARVSVEGANEIPAEVLYAGGDKLINYLMRKKHGSPFEHNMMTFYVKGPIFVFREFQRHRVGWGYNEMSGRYTELPGEFYIPAATRKLRNVGSSANPKFEAGTPEQVHGLGYALETSYTTAWEVYQLLLQNGIAKEVARLVLPVGIMSQMYATCNARSLMNFLALRTSNENAQFPSNPQHEIEMVARKMEAEFARLFPITHEAFDKLGRVAP